MDIVERLGELRLGNKEYDAVVDAIDEIEKLREKVFNLETEVHFDDQAIKSLQEIIERLRDEIFNLKTEVHFDDQTIKSLKEINERLREALRYYANKKEEDWKNGQDDGVIARSALKEGE